MDTKEIARALVAPKKGILAADESTHTATKRFEALGIESNEETRRAYRDMLLTTPGLEKLLSGVILFEETLKQKTLSGVPFPEYLQSRGILPGIKVDEGIVPFEGNEKEYVTDGLETLAERLIEYRNLGAVFTKWRSVITVEEDFLPTDTALRENTRRLAVYAETVLKAGMVPIIEPEMLMAGMHRIERAETILTRTLTAVFAALDSHGVSNESVILKTAMAVPGDKSGTTATPEEVAERTVRALRASVPADIAGVVFLSGGQSPQEAAANLNAIARLEPHPWPITFSYARALQEPAMQAWGGKKEHVPEAQTVFLRRVQLASLAQEGAYDVSVEVN